jgi:hypothetical protein
MLPGVERLALREIVPPEVIETPVETEAPKVDAEN